MTNDTSPAVRTDDRPANRAGTAIRFRGRTWLLLGVTSFLGLGAFLWPLLIEADEGTSYGTLMDVYALAAQAGIRNVVLATRPPPVAP